MGIGAKEQKLEPIISKQAIKYLAKLELRVYDALKSAVKDIPKGNIKPLKGHEPLLRLDIIVNKVSYRIIFEWISDEQLHVVKIKPRGDIYKGGF